MKSLLVPCLAVATLAAAKPTAPNIVVIVADDLGYSDTGKHGGEILTPNLDRLEREGMALNRFYTCPVCSPTRIGLLTGMMPRRFGVAAALSPRDAGMPAEAVTLPSLLKSAGYTTALAGKWHAGSACSPNRAGFDHFYGFLGGEVDYLTHRGPAGRADWWRDGKALEESGYTTTLIADEAVRRIESRDKTAPLYLQVAFNAPHSPVSAPDGYAERYPKLSARRATYAGAVTAMDEGIGRILETLHRQGMDGDTLVVFFSDNGAGGRTGGSNTPLRGGKDTLHEGGIRTLAAVRWPGKIPAGGLFVEPVAVHDLMPTLLSAAGVSSPKGYKPDGVSLWSGWCSGRASPRTPVVVAMRDAAVVDGPWKLIRTESGEVSLYRLDAASGETEEVGAKFPAERDRLKRHLESVLAGLPALPEAKSPGKAGRRR